jgi:hypothetical protein
MNRGMLTNIFLGAVIALLPLFTKVGAFDLNRTSKDNLFVLVVLIALVILPEEKRKLPASLGIFAVYAALNLVINQWNPASPSVMFQAFYIATGIALFVGLYQRFDLESKAYILNGAAIGCFIQSILCLGNVYNLSLYHETLELIHGPISRNYHTGRASVVGSLGNPNLVGSYLALTAMALLRPMWVWLLPFAIAAIVATKSVMAGAALVGGLAYFLNHKFRVVHRFGFYLFAIIAMIAAYLHGARGEDSGRFGAWASILALVDLKHFLFGMGPGWFADLGMSVGGEPLRQEHSAYLSFFNVFGATGCLLVLVGLTRTILGEEKNVVFGSMLFASFLNSYGHFTSHQSTVAILIIIVAAICLAEGNKHELNLER